MKTLESIQKTYKVFRTLAKIAMILSFIWAGTLLLGVLGGIVWQSGGNIVGVSAEYALKLTQTGAILQMIGVLLGRPSRRREPSGSRTWGSKPS